MTNLNPFDPWGVYATWTNAAKRSAEQVREAQRQLKLTSARADVDAAYLMFQNVSDPESAENLIKAVEVFIEACK